MKGQNETAFPAAFAGLFSDRLLAWIAACPGGAAAEELHISRGGLITLTAAGKTRPAPFSLDPDEFDRLLQGLLRGSPYAQEDRLRRGFFLYPGGYRIGVGGSAITLSGQVRTMGEITSLCLRIPHRCVGCGAPLLHLLLRMGNGTLPRQGLLLYGPPGVGKTTLLRDLCEQLAGEPYYFRCAVIDEREELFFCRPAPGLNLDIYTAWPKGEGLDAAVRAAAPRLLLCDELSDEDALRLLTIGCGVPLIASAHAGGPSELLSRPGLGQLLRSGRFFGMVGLHRGQGGLGFSYREILPEVAV